MVGDNFAKAVSGAIAESRRQWEDFGSELIARYGRDKGERMICALTRDDPVNDCRDPGPGRLIVIVLIAGVTLAAAAVILLLVRRHRRHAGQVRPRSD